MKERIPLGVLLVTFLAGCVETIVMDPQEKDRTVAVHCILQGENRAYEDWDYKPTPKTQSLTLRYVKGKSEQDFIPVEDAKVSINYVSGSSSTEETLSFSHVGEGRWESDRPIVIEPETDYSLSIDIPGREPIWAKTSSPPRVFIKPNVIENVFDVEGFYLHSFRFRAAREQGDSPEGREELKGCSVWVYPQEYVAGEWKDLDYVVTNNPYADDFNINNMKFSDLEVLGRPADYHPLLSAETTPAEYYIYCFDGAKMFAPNLPVHEKFVRIDNLEAESYFFLRGGPIWFVEPEGFDPNVFRCLCHFVSKDLDEYLRYVYVHEFGLDHYLTTLYSNSNTQSNVHGGIGIFGCDCVSSLPLLTLLATDIN